MFSTHWDGGGTDDFTEQAQHVVDALAAQTGPHLFMGDLNTFKIDAWNPKVPCTADDTPGRTRAIAIIENGGYIDTWKATQSGEGWTGMASRAGCGSPPGDLFKRIDYVFAKGLTPTSIVRVGRAAPGADSPSDHVGLIGELAIRR
jgi:endonuclease/exonuclease/phosphatase (EEP) superfamily protein YafD